MFKNEGILYVQKLRLGRKDHYQRKAEALAVAARIGIVVKETYVSPKPRGWGTLLGLLDDFLMGGPMKPLIIVPTWGDIRKDEVIEKLVEGSFSIIIADEITDVDDTSVRNEEFIDSGPILKHMVDVHASLRASLNGRRAGHNNTLNERRRSEAREFALDMWKKIKEVASSEAVTDQTTIAELLTANGYRSREGKKIRQSHVTRFIQQAEKSKEWDELKAKIEKSKKQGDLFPHSDS